MKDLKTLSKFISLVLRHNPALIGIAMDSEGWVDVNELITKSKTQHQHFDFKLLEEVVVTSDKQRFAFNADKSKIRANQGHSINVDLQFQAIEPPQFLYHGTVSKFLDSIKADGLLKMSRTHVHLSKELETAIKVGSRRGKPVVLTINTAQMHLDGFKFYLSENKVWLTDAVPVKYIQFADHEK